MKNPKEQSKPPSLSSLRDHTAAHVGSSRRFSRRDTLSRSSHIPEPITIYMQTMEQFIQQEEIHKKTFGQSRKAVEIKGEYGVIDPQTSLDNFDIFQVSYCDGLLLCNNFGYNRIVVLNPCTGETKWIQPRKEGSYALGSYQDNKYGDNCYKILCCCDGNNKEFEIYEINSNLWRRLDATLDCELEYDNRGMFLEGKTYWVASDENEEQLGIFLVSFDYTTEIFERLLLPCQGEGHSHNSLSLSVVREEKLSVLFQHEDTSRTDIWVTTKIDETKVVSWSKVLTVDLKPELCINGLISFLLDEEKKFIVLCHFILRSGVPMKQFVYIVGEDNKVNKVYSGFGSSLPLLCDYVPSLTQIQL